MEEVTVQSEISTWQVVLVVTFGTLYEEIFLDCEPYIVPPTIISSM